MGERIDGMWDYAAYIPYYEDGNSVMAVKKDGHTVMLDKGIKSVIRTLLKDSSMDINAFRQNFSGSVGSQKLIPIPLSLDTVLIPLKVRKTIARNDGSYAYVDMSSIKEITGDSTSVITLSCGFAINCIENVRAVKRRVKVGNMVKMEYALKLRGEIGLKEDMSRVIAEYGKVADFADIILLILDIFKIGGRFGK